MGSRTKIEWTRSADGSDGATWTPIRARNLTTGKVGWHCEHGTGLPFKPGHRKEIEIFLDERMLLAPLRWKKPKSIFICSMTDAFAPFVLNEWLDRMFAVAALAPQHVYQWLTKRSDRMRRYASDPETPRRVEACITALTQTPSRRAMAPALQSIPMGKICIGLSWPLPNCWFGVSVEDQPRADERRDDLAAITAQGLTTFVSYEPALGAVDWTGWEFTKQIISGGESGPRARPSHPDWHRATRDFCAANGIAYFFKQWGSWAPAIGLAVTHRFRQNGEFLPDPDEGIIPRGPGMHRVGKSRAGRFLDGRTWDQFPGAIT